MLCEKGRESGPSDYWQSARCSCRMRRERLIRPTRSCKFNILQEACRPDKRSASGSFAFAISLKGRESGPSDYWQSARCSCRMRRERLIRPTRSCKFNILQEACRPDKRSASGSFAFAISLKGRESGPFLLSRDKRNCTAGDHGIGQFTVPTLCSGKGYKSGIIPQSFTAQADCFCFSRTF